MNFYTTTSIPYLNGEPHLGHAMEFIMADVLARHARAQGLNTLFSIGTDEHGNKVAKKAKEENLSPTLYTDQLSTHFKDLARLLDVSFDRFIRTTDLKHECIVQEIWERLKLDIYKGVYEGWYCAGCESFVSDAVAKANKGICPIHNQPYEKIKEDNYFFKLSKYAPAIQKAIESNELNIIPAHRKNEILQLLKEGLEDISISRPKEKAPWGIPVPDDKSQIIYVWIDALPNYITVLDYPDGDDFKNFWPANYQVIGKDILRFHAAIWPGILLGLGLPLPKNLFVHGFINVDGEKMSKSVGNVVSPSEIVTNYGVDAFRYYFLRHIPSYEDGDFSWQKFHDAYHNELANELGNAVQRTLVMIQNYQDSTYELPATPEANKAVNEAIAQCHFNRALDEIWHAVQSLNQFIDANKPWELHKAGKSVELAQVLNEQVRRLLSIAIDLKPFLPSTSNKIEKIFEAGQVRPLKTTLFPRRELPEGE